MGLFDLAGLLILGIDITMGGDDVTVFIMSFYALTFAALGYALGRLSQSREKARDDARLIEASKQAAIQNEKLAAIGRLAAGVAHEVRNPLGVIRASAAMVQESFTDDDESFRACQFVIEETDRLNQMITALLSFSRPAELHKEPTRIVEVVDHAIRLAKDKLDALDIAIESNVADISVQADRDLLSQVMFDLLVNASEALEAGGRIKIQSETSPTGVIVDVSDSGPGVPAEDRDKVFEPFFTTKPEGTGLGLPMVAKIVRAHGGTIEAILGHGAGVGGAGACFRLSLPKAEAA